MTYAGRLCEPIPGLSTEPISVLIDAQSAGITPRCHCCGHAPHGPGERYVSSRDFWPHLFGTGSREPRTEVRESGEATA